MRNAQNILAGTLNGRIYLEDLEVEGSEVVQGRDQLRDVINTEINVTVWILISRENREVLKKDSALEN